MVTASVRITAHFKKDALTMYHLLPLTTQRALLDDFRACVEGSDGGTGPPGDMSSEVELELDPATGLAPLSEVLAAARGAVEAFNAGGHRMTLSLPLEPICCARWELVNGRWVQVLNYCVDATLAEGCKLPDGMEMLVTVVHETGAA